MDRAELIGRRVELIAAYESSPTNWTGAALMNLALCYTANDNPAKAQLLYMRVLANDSSNATVMVKLAGIHAMQGDFERAVLWAQRAWSLRDAQGLLRLGMLYVARDQADELKPLVQAMLEHRADTNLTQADRIGFIAILLTQALGSRPIDTNLLASALEGVSFDELAKRDDMRTTVLKAYEELSDFKNSRKFESAVAREEAARKEAIVRLDNAQWRRGRIADMYRVAPFWFEGPDLLVAARCLLQEEQWEEAVRPIREVMKFEAQRGVAEMWLGNTDILRDQAKEAEAHFAMAYKLGEPAGLQSVAQLYWFAGRHNDMARLIPELEKCRNDKKLRLTNRLTFAELLSDWALAQSPVRTNLLEVAVAGFSDEELLSRPRGTITLLNALRTLGQSERALRLRGKAETIAKTAPKSVKEICQLELSTARPAWTAEEFLLLGRWYATEGGEQLLKWIPQEAEKSVQTIHVSSQHELAVSCYRRAWEEGDPNGIKALAFYFLNARMRDQICELGPTLLEKRVRSSFEKREWVAMGMVVAICAALAEPRQEEAFYDALSDIDASEMLDYRGLAKRILEAYKKLGDVGKWNRLRKLLEQ